MADDAVADIIKRWEALQGARGAWLGHWEDLARLHLPRRMGFTSSPVNGDRRTEDLYDGTPMQAARGLANAIGGMLRPPGMNGLKMKADDGGDDDEAQAWLASSGDKVKEALETPKARFRQATGEADLDLVVFGTAVLFENESVRGPVSNLMFQSLHLKDVCVFYNDEGEPEGMFRTRDYTVRQAIARFGQDNLSQALRQKLTSNPIGTLDEKLKMLHVVIPRKDAKPGAVLARNLPFADYWIEVDAKHRVKVGGFHEFPFIVPRWDTSSGEDYGRSPGMIALPDAATLQAMGETMLVAGQRVADPPLMAPNDGSFSEANTFPGGISYYDVETAAVMGGKNPFFPLETGANLPITREMQMDVREQVFAAFYRNVLNLPVDGPEMTATEVVQRKEEFIREIGPVFGRLETDYTAPMVNRAFSIMLRAGAFDPIPESLQGRSVRFEYESPVKRIRQQIEASAARMWVAEHIEAAVALQRPEIMDAVNFDNYSRFSAEASGIPNGIVNGADAVEAIRKQRAEAQQQAMEMQAAEQAANVAKTTADAASAAGLTEQAA